MLKYIKNTDKNIFYEIKKWNIDSNGIENMELLFKNVYDERRLFPRDYYIPITEQEYLDNYNK